MAQESSKKSSTTLFPLNEALMKNSSPAVLFPSFNSAKSFPSFNSAPSFPTFASAQKVDVKHERPPSPPKHPEPPKQPPPPEVIDVDQLGFSKEDIKKYTDEDKDKKKIKT